MSAPTTTVVVIEESSEAFSTLAAAFAAPDTYRVSIEPRRDGVAVKRNGECWTPTLRTEGQ